MNNLKAQLCPQVHLEKMQGTYEQASTYCKKEGDYWEDDRRVKPGTPHREYVEACLTLPVRELVQQFPGFYLRYPEARTRLRRVVGELRGKGTPPDIIWVWGPTGSGKTRLVNAIEDTFDTCVFGAGAKILGFTGAAVILFDDFRPDDCPFNLLLRILDRYHTVVDVKYGECEWAPRKIYITSPDLPDVLYRNSNSVSMENIQQLTRRITQFVEMPYDVELRQRERD